MNVQELLEKAVQDHASDIFIVAGLPASYRTDGNIVQLGDEKLKPDDTRTYLEQIYALAGERNMDDLITYGDDDFSFAIPTLSRFRVSAYKQRGTLSAVVRIITFSLPSPDILGIPDVIIHAGNLPKGLVLVTGPAGSGKSTTLACVVNHINETMEKHIITRKTRWNSCTAIKRAS